MAMAILFVALPASVLRYPERIRRPGASAKENLFSVCAATQSKRILHSASGRMSKKDTPFIGVSFLLRFLAEAFAPWDASLPNPKNQNGGSERIRTSGTGTRTHAFQACSLNHSDTLPSSRIITHFPTRKSPFQDPIFSL